MDASVLEKLEGRIASLERRVKGDLADQDQSLVERLTIIDRKINSAIQDEDNLGILKRTDALHTLLDPSLEHNIGVDSCTKLALVEANMDRIEEAKQLLEQMESSRKVLESAHIKTVPTYSGKLASLSEAQAEQVTQAEALTRQTMNMFETYNRMMSDIDRKFAVWDQRLAAAEEMLKAKEGAA
ncbi:dynactin subunit 3-like [Galendromus occidentalis]|uniref:Dynactin subunit 3-like n=1 Tax=Galendromus occidentalis TaxID=34638 RepID=A0AAJ6QQ75_9ACAR|nr:dynactin subunit 3-like [Galendromus occidentalis]